MTPRAITVAFRLRRSVRIAYTRAMQYTVWHLEMNSRDEFVPKPQPSKPDFQVPDFQVPDFQVPDFQVPDFQVIEAKIPAPEFQRFWYTAIGGDWHWTDRLNWTLEQWRNWCDRPELRLFVAYLEGTPAGYFNLEHQGDNIEIKYFGLLPHFTGHGWGAILLSKCLEQAWDGGAKRIHLNTCSLDGPAALRNYQARGFKIYNTEIKDEVMPEKPPGPWPGAH
jgi:GNAT superfamily N-acetyltransferase